MDNTALPPVNDNQSSMPEKMQQLLNAPDVPIPHNPTSIKDVETFISVPQNMDVARPLLEKALRDGNITQSDYDRLLQKISPESNPHPEAPLN